MRAVTPTAALVHAARAWVARIVDHPEQWADEEDYALINAVARLDAVSRSGGGRGVTLSYPNSEDGIWLHCEICGEGVENLGYGFTPRAAVLAEQAHMLAEHGGGSA